MKKILRILLALVFSLSISVCSLSVYARDTVNILTWWGYLDYPDIINAAQKACNVDISYDQYYSIDEFLRRWESQKKSYDVIIFSEAVYNIVKDDIPAIPESTLWLNSAQYHPVIKEHYASKKYPHNVVYFMHALTGFLWNPKIIQISSNDSIGSIFKKAKQNYIVIIDDPTEVQMLIKQNLLQQNEKLSDDIFSTENFKKLISDSRVYVTNSFSQISDKTNFAFSVSWSGDAIVDLIASNNNYRFFIHPNLSYINSDLIAQTSKNPGALCVSKYLSSKKNMISLQNKDFYFSPYIDYHAVSNATFKNIYIDFVSKLPNLHWITSIDRKSFHKINESWELMRLSLNNHSGE